MIFWQVVRVSLKSLAANKLRSVLAMLGIIIGVWSVISALALAAGAQKKVIDQMSTLGTNVIMVTPGQRQRGGVYAYSETDLNVSDAATMLKIPQVARVAPVVRGMIQAKHGDKNANVDLIGAAPTYFALRDFQLAHGRLVSDDDCDLADRVAVLGPSTAGKLFGDDVANCPGQSIEINGVHYRVIGLLRAKGDQGWFHPDQQIVIPYTTAMKQVIGQDSLSEIDVSAKASSSLDVVETRLTLLLRSRHRLSDEQPNDFYARNQADVIKATSTINTVLSWLLGGIAGISLLVGGIGVMNIMLVTVAERTREIGIRKAIGARRRDILRQFLIESVILSLTGGLTGVAGGYVTAYVVSAMQHTIPLVVRIDSALMALAFSAAVGVFFGYYPATRAAKLDPIEALRYE